MVVGLFVRWANARTSEPRVSAPPRQTRHLVVDRIDIVGREQVSLSQILPVLAAEGIGADVVISWPGPDPRVERAKRRLLATGYFRAVTFALRPVPGDDTHVVVSLELEERSSLALTDVFLGSSKLTPFRGGLGVVERNFLGRAVHLGGAFVWGSLPSSLPNARRQQSYRVIARAPRLAGSNFGVGASLLFVSASEPYRVSGHATDPAPNLFRTFDYERIGGVVGGDVHIGPGFTLGIDYRFERISALLPIDPVRVLPDGTQTAIDLDLRDGRHRLTTLRFSLGWDGRETPTSAAKGGRFLLDVELSSPALGSHYEYLKLVVGGAYGFRLPRGHTLTPRLLAGQIAGNAPRFEQFYSGDLSDWTPGRELGLLYSTRTPIDVFDTGIASRTFGVMFARTDLEYAFPLFRRVFSKLIYGGDIYVSAGVFTIAEPPDVRAERRRHDEFVAPLGFNANAGIRIDTVIGTFDLSIGNLLRRTPL